MLMRLFKTKKSQIVATTFSGRIKVHPENGHVGYYDDVSVYADTPAGVLDKLVEAAGVIVQKAEKADANLDAGMYVSFEWPDLGHRDYPMGAGGSDTLNGIINRAGHIRYMALSTYLHDMGDYSDVSRDSLEDVWDYRFSSEHILHAMTAVQWMGLYEAAESKKRTV